MFEQYRHHGYLMWTKTETKGKHRDFCLCYSCKKLNTQERENNCPIADKLYKLCCEHTLVTPVFECKEFEAK